ncbi:hypothetical protein D3C86_1880340 [compost metagenome]
MGIFLTCSLVVAAVETVVTRTRHNAGMICNIRCKWSLKKPFSEKKPISTSLVPKIVIRVMAQALNQEQSRKLAAAVTAAVNRKWFRIQRLAVL